MGSSKLTIELDDEETAYGVSTHERLLNQLQALISTLHPQMAATITDHKIERSVVAVGEDHRHDVEWEDPTRWDDDLVDQRGVCTGCGAIFERSWERSDAELVGEPDRVTEVVDGDD